MKIKEAYPICKDSVGIPFKVLFPNFNKDEIIKNKGKAGQLMEKYCGLKLTNAELDFEDGELKTSELKESTAITMITSWVDDIIHNNRIAYADTKLANKIKSMILMPLEKPSSDDPSNWYFKDCFYIPITRGTVLYDEIKKDFENICLSAHELVYKKKITNVCKITENRKLYSKTNGDGFLHTISGKHIQIRTKGPGGTKDKPIYSKKLDRTISKKGTMAFYFHSSFKKYVYENFK